MPVHTALALDRNLARTGGTVRTDSIAIPTRKKMMNSQAFYPIGNPGEPWGDDERNQWRASQSPQRRYNDDVVPRIEALADRFEEWQRFTQAMNSVMLPEAT